MSVRLVWATPNADKLLASIARVSNPANQSSDKIEGLLRYMIRHGHWSPFEMVSACVEIETTRDIGRQILRHRSFSFQEFSQRYQFAAALPDAPVRETRLQDTTNRQNSLLCEDDRLATAWEKAQEQVLAAARDTYRWAVNNGIAKEQARAVLPEGLTMSRMYMAGTLRSWIHYLQQRTDPATQKEHREIAAKIRVVLQQAAPVTLGAVFDEATD